MSEVHIMRQDIKELFEFVDSQIEDEENKWDSSFFSNQTYRSIYWHGYNQAFKIMKEKMEDMEIK